MLPYKLEEKVDFFLHWYGWCSKRDYVSGDLKKALDTNYPLFQGGINFIRQFGGLILPGKCTSSCQGSQILLSFIWEPVILEDVSHHFGERVISIGVEHLFDGYDETVADCWEDISIYPDQLDYDCNAFGTSSSWTAEDKKLCVIFKKTEPEKVGLLFAKMIEIKVFGRLSARKVKGKKYKKMRGAYGKTKINRLCGGGDAADFSGGGGLSLH